jgi:LMBR1 domain-containing protein 1
MKIELPIYVMGIISFLGFFFFVLFGGVGLSALPIELIRSFMNRPTVVKRYF